MARHSYKTKNVCSQQINFDLEGNVVKNIEFIGGCNGNTQGVAALAKGMKVADAIERLEGIHCGPRPTSCPDQLATALRQG